MREQQGYIKEIYKNCDGQFIANIIIENRVSCPHVITAEEASQLNLYDIVILMGEWNPGGSGYRTTLQRPIRVVEHQKSVVKELT